LFFVFIRSIPVRKRAAAYNVQRVSPGIVEFSEW
jgi:hypothetical protein